MIRKIMLMGPVASGKTSLIQRLKGEAIHYQKTQAVEFDGATIDTPGEYMENRQYLYALTVTACEADLVVFTQDAVSETMWYSPGQATMFTARVIGVITKTDLATAAQIEVARNTLQLAGAEKIFPISNVTGDGIQTLLTWLSDQNAVIAGGKEGVRDESSDNA